MVLESSLEEYVWVPSLSVMVVVSWRVFGNIQEEELWEKTGLPVTQSVTT